MLALGKVCYDRNFQRIYLIENAYQNAFEYRHIFLDVLNEDHRLRDSNKEVKLISIGCGAMTDYFALQLALKALGHKDRKITYLGCDKVNWDYKFEPRKNDDVFFYHNDAAVMFQKTTNLSADMYFFPKSIREIDHVRFEAICTAFAEREIVSNKFRIVISKDHFNINLWHDEWYIETLIGAVCSNDFALSENDPIGRRAVFSEEIKDFEYKILTFVRLPSNL